MQKITEKRIKIGELAELAGVRKSTIKFYTEEGLLPFQQADAGLVRWYEKTTAVKILNKIKSLRDKRRLTIAEIKEQFSL